MPKIRPSQHHGNARAANAGASSSHRKEGGDSQGAGGGTTVRTLLTPNTGIGQHFLKNPAIVDSIVAKVELILLILLSI